MIIFSSLVIFVITLFWSSKYWSKAVKISLFVAVLEGALRKWLVPQASEIIYLFKDILLLGAYYGFFSRSYSINKISKKYLNPIKALTPLIAMWGLLQLLNPNMDSLIVSIFGLKNYFFYIPLLWIVPQTFTRVFELKQYINIFLLLLLPVGFLAILQFFSPPDSVLNIYAPSAVDLNVALTGNWQNVRVTGTFSYISGYTIYLSLCLALLLPLLAQKQVFRWTVIKILCLFLIIITLFMSGSRGLLFSTIAVIFAFIILQGSKVFSLLSKFAISLTFPLMILYIIITKYFSDAVNGLLLRLTENQDIGYRIVGVFAEPFTFLRVAGLLGYGPGSAFQGTIAIRQLLDLGAGIIIPVYYESEPGRVTLEIGFIGFLIWYTLRFLIIVANWKIFLNLKNSFLKRLSLSIFLIQILNLPGQIVFNHTANLFYWFLNGLVLSLPYLDSSMLSYESFNFNRSSNPKSILT